MELLEPDRRAIRSVIERQIEAFQQGDETGAFACASPGIQMQFGTAANFIAMVKAAYEPVYRPRSVIFSDTISVEDCPAQKVLLMGQDEELFTAVYMMEKQSDQSWRIQGCFLIPIEGKTFNDQA